MSEHGFVRSIHRKLPKEVYRWKVADRFTNGVPDAWYSGPAGDVWVEYKYIPRTPRKAYRVEITDLQKKWLMERAIEGRNVAVIVGCPTGAAIFQGAVWVDEQQKRIDPLTLSIAEIAQWLATQTLGPR